MQTHFWRRVRGRKLKRRSRGFSSVVGAIFMTVIVWILASSYFVWTLSQNTVYNEAIREKDQLESDIQSESVQVTNTTYDVKDSDYVFVSAKMKNIGSLSVQFLTLWVRASNPITPYSGCNFTKQLSNPNLQGGEDVYLTANVPVEGVRPKGNYSFAAWLITSRGNVVPLQEFLLNTIIVAQTTEGIGAISFSFEQFWHYEFKTTPLQGTPFPSPTFKNYTVSASNYTVYHVVLTDLDRLGQTIVLNGNSSIYIIGQHEGTVKYSTWNLVNVTNNKIYPQSGVEYILPFNVPTELYFSGQIKTGMIDTDCAYPLNILLCGTKGNSDYGQNIPFVSIYLVP